MSTVDSGDKIPNNVGLADDRRLQRALERWQPQFLDWWKQMGPVAHQDHDVYLRTAVSVGQEGWAHFGYVKMPDYRWGIFLADAEAGPHHRLRRPPGQPVWQDVPGELRSDLRRLIVVQGDTEPASVEQQRQLCLTAPSLYDLRNLFQVNVEEGRHLWAMVYLLHGLLRPGRARRGRPAAGSPLRRHRQPAHPRAPSTSRPRTGCRSSCSPTSPTGTASSSWRRWPRAASIRWPAPASSCSRRRPTTCSSAPPGSAGWCSARPS